MLVSSFTRTLYNVGTNELQFCERVSQGLWTYTMCICEPINPCWSTLPAFSVSSRITVGLSLWLCKCIIIMQMLGGEPKSRNTSQLYRIDVGVDLWKDVVGCWFACGWMGSHVGGWFFVILAGWLFSSPSCKDYQIYAIVLFTADSTSIWRNASEGRYICSIVMAADCLYCLKEWMITIVLISKIGKRTICDIIWVIGLFVFLKKLKVKSLFVVRRIRFRNERQLLINLSLVFQRLTFCVFCTVVASGLIINIRGKFIRIQN